MKWWRPILPEPTMAKEWCRSLIALASHHSPGVDAARKRQTSKFEDGEPWPDHVNLRTSIQEAAMPDHKFLLASLAQVAGVNRGTSLCGFSPVVTILARQLGEVPTSLYLAALVAVCSVALILSARPIR